jgi:hypothetical protein
MVDTNAKIQVDQTFDINYGARRYIYGAYLKNLSCSILEHWDYHSFA